MQPPRMVLQSLVLCPLHKAALAQQLAQML
jgi:hypothetical protein